jgi:magnesium-transporting ATPase (P-type)
MTDRTWHSIPVVECLALLNSSKEGLTEAEAAERLRLHGRNLLPRRRPPNLLWLFLRQFRSPLIYAPEKECRL